MKLVRQFEEGDIVISTSYPWSAVRNKDGRWEYTDDSGYMHDSTISMGLDKGDYKYLGVWKDLLKKS